MLKRRINSATSGFPQSSAKSGESIKKTPRCRPSSAPVTAFRSFHVAGANAGKNGKKTLEEGSASLKIEGKAIRSQTLNFTRKQAISRGAVKVYSSYRHPFYTPKRKFQNHSKYNYTKNKLDSNIRYGISKSSFDISNEIDNYSDYTTNSNEQSCSITEYSQSLMLNNFFFESPNEKKEEDFSCNSSYIGKDSIINVNEPSSRVCNSYLTDEDDDANFRPTIRLVSKPVLCKAFKNSGVNEKSAMRLSETESVSNDEGSESTVVSLGQKIQQMAEQNAKCPAYYYDNDDNVGLQDEWMNLLKYNHSLLLNESPYETTSDSKYSSHDNQGKISSSAEDSDIEVISVKENDRLKSLEAPEKILEEEKTPLQLFYPSALNSKTSKSFCAENTYGELHNTCKLEDIIEENLQREEISDWKPSLLRENETENKKTVLFLGQSENENGKNNINNSLIMSNIKDSKLENKCSSLKGKNNEEDESPVSYMNTNQSQIDDKETIKMENEKLEIWAKPSKNSANSLDNLRCKSDFGGPTKILTRFPTPLRKPLKHQPKDILQALEMINIEQSKDRENAMTEDVQSKSENPDIDEHNKNKTIINKSSTNSENSFEVNISQLIQKILIFVQDLETKLNSEDISKDNKEKVFPSLANAEKILDKICIKEKLKEDEKNLPEFHRECEEKLAKCQKELEERIHKNLELIRKLLDDKKILTDKYEELSTIATRKERCHLDKLKLLNDQHTIEMKALKEKLSAADLIRREKWAQQKTKLIKDSTYRGLETKIKDLTTHHREEMARLKETHWKELRDKEETWIQKLREQEEQIKSKFEKEKEDECKRERDREEERFQHEIRQSEVVWQSRLDALQRQFSLNKIEKEEDFQRQIHRLKIDHEQETRNLRKEMDTFRDEYETKIRNTARLHENEMASLRQNNDRAQAEWREQISKDYEEVKQKFDKELRERLRRQRDKEIEKAITEIQQETTIQIEEKQRSFDQKLKNIRDRYETELQDLEECEKISRTRYLEMKGLLTQREEEIVYLRARLHTQTMELSDYQQMFNSND